MNNSAFSRCAIRQSPSSSNAIFPWASQEHKKAEGFVTRVSSSVTTCFWCFVQKWPSNATRVLHSTLNLLSAQQWNVSLSPSPLHVFLWDHLQYHWRGMGRRPWCEFCWAVHQHIYTSGFCYKKETDLQWKSLLLLFFDKRGSHVVKMCSHILLCFLSIQPNWTVWRRTCHCGECHCDCRTGSSNGLITSGCRKNPQMKLTPWGCYLISWRRRSLYMYTSTPWSEWKSFRIRRQDSFVSLFSSSDQFSSPQEITSAEKVSCCVRYKDTETINSCCFDLYSCSQKSEHKVLRPSANLGPARPHEKVQRTLGSLYFFH